MQPSTTKPSPRKGGTRHGTVRATLAAIGFKLRQRQLWQPIQDPVKIRQKTVKHTPLEKLLDGWIAILAGAHGLVEINRRLRNDPGLQAALGRERCAEQSVVQETLSRCTAGNVAEMQAAMEAIDRKHSQGFRHDYQAGWQLLDVETSGMPCGKKAAFATKGYFAHQRHRRGRQ